VGGLRVLYVGGTGTISWSCVKASVERGHEVFVLNRGKSLLRELPREAKLLQGDAQDGRSLAEATAGHRFDAVVNFVSFTPEHARDAAAAFRGRVGQYVHISTAALYQKPPRRVPYLESTPRHSPGSPYAYRKIAAENVLLEAYESEGFPVTIVRPSHTYDDVHPPLPGDWTIVERIERGAEIVVPGDGTSLWTLTHAEDFAIGLLGLLGNPFAVGEAFHITSDFVYNWNQIYEMFASAMGREAKLVHVPSELLSLAAPDWFWSELIAGDLQYSAIFDNSKICAFVPEYRPTINFSEGVRRMLRQRALRPEIAVSNRSVDAVVDRLASGYHQAATVFASLAP
jgi:nucleoside-diphosphate-sugar epimerase